MPPNRKKAQWGGSLIFLFSKWLYIWLEKCDLLGSRQDALVVQSPADCSCVDPWNILSLELGVKVGNIIMGHFFFFLRQVMLIHQKRKTENMAVLMRHKFRLNVGWLKRMVFGGKTPGKIQLAWSNSPAVWLGVTSSALIHWYLLGGCGASSYLHCGLQHEPVV